MKCLTYILLNNMHDNINVKCFIDAYILRSCDEKKKNKKKPHSRGHPPPLRHALVCETFTKRKSTHHALAGDAHVRALRPTPRAVLHLVRQLHHYRLVAVETQSVGEVARQRRPLARRDLLPRASSIADAVLEARRLYAAADQRAGPGLVVMGIPLQQLSTVRHVVEGGALGRAKIARFLAGLKSEGKPGCIQCASSSGGAGLIERLYGGHYRRYRRACLSPLPLSFPPVVEKLPSHFAVTRFYRSFLPLAPPPPSHPSPGVTNIANIFTIAISLPRWAHGRLLDPSNTHSNCSILAI